MAMKAATSARVTARGAALGLLLVAFALRLHKLTWLPMSRDEIITLIRYAPRPITEILSTHYSNNHPLASALAHLFSPQADHLFMLRWPSVLIGLLSLALAYRLSVDLFGRRAGLLLLLLLGVSPTHLGYSMIVRGYIGLIGLTLAAFFFLWRAFRDDRWYHWAGFVAASLLVVYFHLFGALAIGIALSLLGVWFLWHLNRPGSERPAIFRRRRFRFILLKFGLATLLVLVLYITFSYTQTQAVLAEGGYSGEFEAWRQVTSWSQFITPLVTLLGQMGPLSPKGVGAYIYLFFGLIGLAVVWRRNRILALLVLAWFLAPLGLIFGAMQLLGSSFYAYARFLIYLLPSFLLLVALGLVAAADWLRLSTRQRGKAWQAGGRIIGWGAGAGLSGLIVISLNWYTIRGANANWPEAAGVLSGRIQPEDITVCEQYQRGLEAPDRAKPYCLWMLDFFLPELEEYTPHFQDSIDSFAGADYLLERRAALARPGSVWLVIWQKVIFNVEHLITAEAPVVLPISTPASVSPDHIWRFGSAVLIHIDSADTLLGNIYQTVELLLEIQPAPADQARYYRGLAELEAIQGHAGRAQEFFQKSWALVAQAGQNPAQYLDDTAQLIKRVPDYHTPPATAFKAGYPLGSSLCLQAYEVWPAAPQSDRPLTLTLYWHTLDFVDADYTFFLRLDNELGQVKGRLEFQPFDRMYPTPWWWPGQLLVERREFAVPSDLAGQHYQVQLGAYDQRSPETELLVPLFSMSYQADSARWQIENETALTPTCP